MFWHHCYLTELTVITKLACYTVIKPCQITITKPSNLIFFIYHPSLFKQILFTFLKLFCSRYFNVISSKRLFATTILFLNKHLPEWPKIFFNNTNHFVTWLSCANTFQQPCCFWFNFNLQLKTMACKYGCRNKYKRYCNVMGSVTKVYLFMYLNIKKQQNQCHAQNSFASDITHSNL